MLMIDTLKAKRTTIITLTITFSVFLLFYWNQSRFLGSVSDTEPVIVGAGNPATEMQSNYSRRRSLYLSRTIQADIKKNCEKLGISTEWNFYKTAPPAHLIAQESTHIVYGAVAKSGSSSFKKFLYLTEGDICLGDPHPPDKNGKWLHWKRVNRIHRFFESAVDLASYVKIAPIRNPIVRLVSAFRDKQLPRFIFLSKKEVKGLSDTEVFVKFINRLFVRRGLNNIINNDEHLQPQWENLEICTFPYDILMPMEHPEHSIELLQELTNTTHIPFPHVVPGEKRREKQREIQGKLTNTHRSTLDFAREYFNSLSSIQLEAVMLHYKRDFEVLGYTRLHERGFPELSIGPIEQNCW